MSDRFPSDSDQDETPLAPGLARLHARLLREGERWRQDEPSTARLERHVQALAQRGTAERHNGHGNSHNREGSMLAERNPVHQLPAPYDAPARQGTRSRRRGLLPVAAAVLLVALAGSIFALFGPGRARHGNRTTATATATAVRVTAVRPAHLLLPMPANGFLFDISFSSAHDGWAVGGTFDRFVDGQDFSNSRPVLLHYHDGVWTASSDIIIPNAAITNVSMVSADDGWAVGVIYKHPNSNAVSMPFLLHYTGGHWQRVDPPALTPPGYLGTFAGYAIHMLSPDFGYITGEINVMPPGANTADIRFQLLVYQNGTWSSIPNTFDVSAGIGVAMVSPNEGWATSGVIGSPSVFYHYLDGVWTKTTTYQGLAYTMHVVTARNIWATGMVCTTLGQQCKPLVYHYDGASWSPVTTPATQGWDWTNSGAVAITADAAGDVWVSLSSTDFSQKTGPWQFREYLYTYAHGIWALTSLPVTDAAVVALTTDGNGGTWAFVQGGPPSFTNYVLYTPNTTWSVYGHS